MMNTNKFSEFFDGADLKDNIHVVGVGAIGSHVCEQLARLNFQKVHIWDFDTVSDHNIANQMYTSEDIGKKKTEAISEYMTKINPEIEVIRHDEGLEEPYILNGYVFMCVDSIELRKKIVNANKYNVNCKGIMDFRMRLVDAQCYYAQGYQEIEWLLTTMDFTSEEASASTPVSACGIELSVIYAPKTIVSLGIANMVKVWKDEEYGNMILFSADTMSIDNIKYKPRKSKNDFLSRAKALL